MFKSYVRTLITVGQAYELLDRSIAKRTIYNGGMGTDVLTRVPFGRNIRLIKQEVEAFKWKQMKSAGLTELKDSLHSAVN